MKRIPDVVKMILLQTAVGFVFKAGKDSVLDYWRDRVSKYKETKGDTFIDTAKTSLFINLKKYVTFKNNLFNAVDVRAAAQMNKIPIADAQLHELIEVCSLIETHETTGFGYLGVPAWIKKKFHRVDSYFEALERQASLPSPEGA